MPDYIGRFELISPLGRGGMGVVWKARDAATGHLVAIKLLHETFSTDPEYVKRFEREIESARRVNSPNCVKVLGFGKKEGVPYLVMEFVGGKSLRDVLKERGPLPWDAPFTRYQVKSMAQQLAVALEAVHKAGVVHRDIKPSNIVFANDGTVKLVDFGIARAVDLTALTGTEITLGTPNYTAPDRQTTARGDLYSLGVTLYEALLGKPPFVGDTQQSVLLKHLREAPDFSRIPPEAQGLLARLLEKDPKKRTPSARALSALLRDPEDRKPRGGIGIPHVNLKLLSGVAVLVAVAAVIAVANIIAPEPPPAAPATPAATATPALTDAAFQDEAISLINKERARRGLPEFHRSAVLDQTAAAAVKHMVESKSCTIIAHGVGDEPQYSGTANATSSYCGGNDPPLAVVAFWFSPGGSVFESKERLDVGIHRERGRLPGEGQTIAVDFAAPTAKVSPGPLPPPQTSGAATVTITNLELTDQRRIRVTESIHNNGTLLSFGWTYDSRPAGGTYAILPGHPHVSPVALGYGAAPIEVGETTLSMQVFSNTADVAGIVEFPLPDGFDLSLPFSFRDDRFLWEGLTFVPRYRGGARAEGAVSRRARAVRMRGG